MLKLRKSKEGKVPGQDQGEAFEESREIGKGVEYLYWVTLLQNQPEINLRKVEDTEMAVNLR